MSHLPVPMGRGLKLGKVPPARKRLPRLKISRTILPLPIRPGGDSQNSGPLQALGVEEPFERPDMPQKHSSIRKLLTIAGRRASFKAKCLTGNLSEGAEQGIS